ncbi:hypothetical protein V6N12_042654 [Hibiscus sabdariffa]|uniref:Uncharacterized protein n=1 Tax=Hibiscus sabdariffa TaxID=183260 RepID=A0ABR1Z7Z5_9ROSI
MASTDVNNSSENVNVVNTTQETPLPTNDAVTATSSSRQSVSSPHILNTRDTTTQTYDYNTSQVTQTGHTGYNYNNRGLPYNTVYCCNALPSVGPVTGSSQMLQPSQHLVQPQSQVMYASSSIPQHVLQSQSPMVHASNAPSLSSAAAIPSVPYYPMSSVTQVAHPQFAAVPAQLQPQVHLTTTEIVDDNAW